jgi:hypothetical protein
MGLFKVTDKRFALYGMTVVLFGIRPVIPTFKF